MNFLFFDTETNGLPKNYSASYTDVDNWPRVIQLAWILTDDTARVLHEHVSLIKPDGWIVPREKFWIENGHSTERNEAEGAPMGLVLEPFMEAKAQADVLVAHNMSFDHPILWAEIIRSGREPISGKVKCCTMRSTIDFCQIPYKSKRSGFKFPKLEELHQVLFGKGFEGAHDALADIRATKDCFFELVARGVINPQELTNTKARA